MRPAYPRPEGDVMRAARQADLALHRARFADWLAIAVAGCAFLLLLAFAVGGAVSLLDWLDGRPNQVWPQLAALLARMD